MFQDTGFKYSNVQSACEIFVSEIYNVLVDLRLFMILISIVNVGDSYATLIFWHDSFHNLVLFDQETDKCI